MTVLKGTLERELKLGAGRGFALPDLPGAVPLEPRVFTSTYFDTADFRLARRGVTLRRRVEQRRGLWQLKLPRGVARLELEAPGGPAGPPPAMRDLVVAYLRHGRLEPIAKLRTRRAGVRVTSNGGAAPVADVTLDLVAVVNGRRVTRSFREIEAELVNGNEKALRRIERLLRKAGAHDADDRPKLFRAIDLERTVPPEPPPADAPAADHLQAALVAQAQAMLAHDPGTRLGSDPEELHQMRVATRRFRAFLRAARPMLDPAWAEPIRAELAWVGGALGPVRDLDVLITHLHEDAAVLTAREQRALRRLFVLLERERDADREILLEALRSERYLALLDRLDTALVSLPITDAAIGLRQIAAAEFRRLWKAARRLGDEPTDAELHALRIRGKRARYAAELAEPTVGKRATAFIQEAKAFQDVLGDHQDAVVAEAKIRSLLGQVGGAALAFAAGRLVEREERRREAARSAFPQAWKQLRKQGRKAWS